jgi:uncharacterized protein with HEPN domain
MRRSVRIYLADIQQCIAELELFTRGKAYDDYLGDALLQRAAEREFTIIAEALSHILKISTDTGSRVSELRSINAFRNLVVHEYFHVDHNEVWSAIQNDIPILKQEVEAWASELDAKP